MNTYTFIIFQSTTGILFIAAGTSTLLGHHYLGRALAMIGILHVLPLK
ncbi:MAG: hypothetical protein HY363_02420 [Candidatus Aenigmarchaeota archaeon]|nr:hypothetical protein [Candidatus Aenigmarchaeota archaeon]